VIFNVLLIITNIEDSAGTDLVLFS